MSANFQPDVREIYRQLDTLTDAELERLCNIEFPGVGANFPPGMARDSKQNKLVTYCSIKGELGRLAQILNVGSAITPPLSTTTTPSSTPQTGGMSTPPSATAPAPAGSSQPAPSLPSTTSVTGQHPPVQLIVIGMFLLSMILGAVITVVVWETFRCYLAYRITEVVLGLLVILVPLVLSFFGQYIRSDVRDLLRAFSVGLAVPVVFGIFVAISIAAPIASACGV
jgi:hypothetical protein